MEQPTTPKSNRINEALNAWDRMEQKFVNRYGPQVVKDPGFLKAKRNAFKDVINKYKSKPLNAEEKAEFQVLRSQHRKVQRQIYPNPIVRLARNLLVFAFKAVKATLRGVFGAVSTTADVVSGNRAARMEKARYVHAPRLQIDSGLTQSPEQKQAPANGKKQTATSPPKKQQPRQSSPQKTPQQAAKAPKAAVVHKMNQRPRTVKMATTTKGMRR